MNSGTFTINGVGSVVGLDLTSADAFPHTFFADGVNCFGLPRTLDEVHPLGYENVALSNFIHESIHLFLSWKGDYIERSVSYRAGIGADFEHPEILLDAVNEERIIVGFQIAQNKVQGDWLKTYKVGGFGLHLAGAAQSWAEYQIESRFGYRTEELLEEFNSLLVIH